MTTPEQLMRSIIQRIATGPQLSKDISLDEARLGMQAILDGQIDPVQAALFLIGLRMKRESDDEQRGVLEAIQSITTRIEVAADEIVDIGDPYDGYNRCLPAAPFLPVILAECGIPAFSHGLDRVGPKFGVTHRHVLQAAGLDVDLTPEAAAARLADPKIGWAYLDQKMFAPKLHQLVDFRAAIVKRHLVTTTEVLAHPLRGRLKTHLVTGYVHKAYPRIYSLLARHAGFDSALLVNGTEGGVVPCLRQLSECFNYHQRGEEQPFEVNPTTLGIEQSVRSVPLPDNLPTTNRPGDDIAVTVDVAATAQAAAEAGRAALAGQHGPTYDSLVFAGAIILWHLNREQSLAAAADRVRAVLDSGVAIHRLH
jgi:anthranilate phosphoribosyltransferase